MESPSPRSADQDAAFDQILEDFAARCRSGAAPDMEVFLARLPERGGELRELLVAIEEMESVAREDAAERSLASASAPSLPLERLGDYRIVREIGRGGMGVVYEAIEEALERRVALKVLPAHAILDERRVRRFHSEARAVANLHHSNIVPVFGVGNDKGIHYYSMQFIDGQPLDQVLREVRELRKEADVSTGPSDDALRRSAIGLFRSASENGRESARESAAESSRAVPEGVATVLSRPSGKSIDPPEGSVQDSRSTQRIGSGTKRTASEPASSTSGSCMLADAGHISTDGEASLHYFRNVARIGQQVAEALAYAHNHGILHRDIKPSNLLLDLDGDVWVTDFGLAKTLESEVLTHTGDVVGTLAYMSPERLRGWSDPRSDVYGLGMALYEMVALRPAFRGTDRGELVRRVSHDDAEPLHRIEPRVPRDLETIIHKAIEKEPERRYETAEAMARDLGAFLEYRPILARRTATHERLWRWCRRNPAIAAMLCAVLALIAASLGALSYAVLQRDEARLATEEKEEAQHNAMEARFWRLVNEAGALRRSGAEGHRFESLSRLEKAAKLLDQLELSPREHERRAEELRSSVIASTSRADLREYRRWRGFERGTKAIDFDAALATWARANENGSIELRRVEDNSLIASFSTAPSRPGNVRLSPSGELLGVSTGASSGEQGSARLRVWSTTTKQLMLDTEIDRLASYGFHPKLRRVAVSRPSGKLVVVDLDHEARPVWSSERGGGKTYVRLLAFSPAGDRLAVSIEKVGIEIHDLTGSRDPLRIAVGGGGPLAFAWHPDGDLIASGAYDDRIRVFNSRNGRRVSTARGPVSHVLWPTFSPDGTLLACRSWDSVLRLWNASGGEPLFGARSVSSSDRLHFAGDPPILAHTRDGDDIVLWEVAPGNEFVRLERRSQDAHDCDFGLEGRLFAIATEGGVEFWDVRRSRPLGHLDTGTTSGVHFGPSSDFLITVSLDRGIHRWPIVRIETGSEIELRIGTPRLLTSMVRGTVEESSDLSPDGSTLAYVFEDRVHLLGIEDAELEIYRTWQQRITGVSLRPDGGLFATTTWGSDDNAVFDTRTGRRLKDLAAEREYNPSFSPDGRYLVTAKTSEFHLYRATDLTDTYRWKRPRGSVPGCAAIGPRGRLAILTTLQNEPVIFDLEPLERNEDPRLLARLEIGDRRVIHRLRLSDGGECLAALTPGLIWVWDLARIRAVLARLSLDWPGSSQPTKLGGPPRRIRMSFATERAAAAPVAERRDEEARYSRALLEQTMARVESALRERPGDAELHYSRGREFFQRGEFEKALKDFEIVTAAETNRSELASYFAGFSAYQSGHFTRALRFFDDAGSTPGRGWIPISLLRAFTYLELHDPGSAIREFEACLERGDEGRDAQTLNNLAWTYVTAPPPYRNAERALDLVDEALVKDPGKSTYLNTRGAALFRLGRWKEAIESLGRSLQAKDNRLPVADWLFLAMAHGRTGALEKGLEYLRKARGWLQSADSQGVSGRDEFEALLREASATLEEGKGDS